MKVAKPIKTDNGARDRRVEERDVDRRSHRPGDFQQFTVSVGLPDDAAVARVQGAADLQRRHDRALDRGHAARWPGARSPGAGADADLG